MERFLLGCALLCAAQFVWALPSYLQASKLPAGELSIQLSQVEQKLKSEGFTVLGKHTPKGIAAYATLVVSDPDMLEAIRTSGSNSSIIAAGIGVGSDGAVTYMNPDYWCRAYLRGHYRAASKAIKSVQQRLENAPGAGTGFGGDVPQGELANYRYMFGMERFDSENSLLGTHGSFEEALNAVQTNLARGEGDTPRVYEVLMPAQKKMTVCGVAMNSASDGESWWVNKIGADHPAGLPYEVFIVDNKVYALYARYRVALAWPALGMGIINAPEAIRTTLLRVAAADVPGN